MRAEAGRPIAKALTLAALVVALAGEARAQTGADPCGASESRAGSILIFNYVLAHDGGTTQFSIPNTGPSHALVQGFWIDTTTSPCQVVDFFILLTQGQPFVFDATTGAGTGGQNAAPAPGDQNLLVVIAVSQTGCQMRYNFLAGTAFVEAPSGHVAALPAIAVRAVTGTTGQPVGTTPGQIDFNDVCYEKMPAQLIVDHVGSELDGNETLIVVNRVGNLDFAGGLSSAQADLRGTLFDAVGKGKPFESAFPGCFQLVADPSQFFPSTFDLMIPAGRSGAMELRVTESQNEQQEAILGAVLFRNPDSATDPSAFRGGHNLHAVGPRTTAVWTFPCGI